MNNISLIGRLTRDPELRYAAGNGTAVCKFTLAVNRQFKKDEVDFINCVAFGKTGEIISQYLSKGRMLGVQGSLQIGSYDAQDGTKKYTADVIIQSFTFCDNSNNNNDNNQSSGNNNFSNNVFDDDIMPVDDEDMPF